MQRRSDSRVAGRWGPFGQLARAAREPIDFSFLCLTPACHDHDVEVPCAPETLLAGREVTCEACGARYRLTVTKAAGTYLVLPTQVLRN